MLAINDNLSDLSVFTAHLKQFYDNNKWDRGQTGALKDEDSKYKWKLKAPKDGESTSKMVLSDGKRKKYHWCEYHKLTDRARGLEVFTNSCSPPLHSDLFCTILHMDDTQGNHELHLHYTENI